MEENQEVTNNEQNNNQENAQNNETKFTQEQFNEALRNEVARKTKGMPNKEELEEFRKWKEKQQQNDDQQDEEQKNEEKENPEIDLEKQNAINENKVLKSGVNPEFSEFVTYQVSKMEGEFSKNLTKFLKDNPKYLTSNDNTKFVKKIGSSLNLEGSKQAQTTNQTMNDLIRSARD